MWYIDFLAGPTDDLFFKKKTDDPYAERKQLLFTKPVKQNIFLYKYFVRSTKILIFLMYCDIPG